MQKNDIIHGFKVLYKQDLPEIGATMWRMEHQKNGADLIWLERPDDNKTFCIGFKTIPHDHTGVFHILEHSVLNGSRKYPIKEPFVELIKSSMATFINAMTYPDKTVYPVCSRNPKDFMNLMDVYLDAVMHPMSITDPHAFRQEGWHYELDSKDGELRCNGVVYNEMKGAFASNDEVMSYELGLALFPDNCYKYVSGGHPEHIPELTYENYLASHRRFYHPSNAKIVLDGDVDIDAALEKIDNYIGEFDRLDVDADIPMQKPVTPPERVARYEIGSEENEKNKAIIAGGWVFNTFEDYEKALGFDVLADALCETNESPLTKAILDAGLAEDVSLYSYDGVQQPFANLVIKNCDPEKRDEIWALVEKTLKELSKNGLDHKHLLGILNSREFAAREKDYGSMPKGLVYALTPYETCLYGGDPAQNFSVFDKFNSLREKVDGGWFENLIKEVFLENNHNAKVCLLPSKTLGEEKRQKEAERCAKIKASWTDAEIENTMEEFKALRARQETPDTPEQVGRLPKLKLSDIPKEGKKTPQNIENISGVKVLHQPLNTDGIIYLDMYFSLSDFTREELKRVSMLSRLLTNVATEHFAVLELSSELQRCLGRFINSGAVFAPLQSDTDATPYFTVKIALLEKSKSDAVRLANEVLLHSKFDDVPYIYNFIRQTKIGLEQSVTMRGNSFASRHALASHNVRYSISEAMDGIDFLRYVQLTEGAFSEKGAEFCAEYKALCDKIFTKDRLTVSITGPLDRQWLESVISVFKDADMSVPVKYQLNDKVKTGYSIPAEIGFAGLAGTLTGIGGKYCGSDAVAAQLLTYDYLWNDVRVKGGAYGVHLNIYNDGCVSFTSYRDPNPGRSLCSFRACGEVLRRFCDSSESEEKYIISTLNNTDPLLTPRAEGDLAARRYLCGITPEDVERERAEILSTTKAELRAVADALDKVVESAETCVVGGRNVLDSCGLEKVEALQ